MKKLAMIVICLFLMGLSAVYADNDTGATRLHVQCPQYKDFKPSTGKLSFQLRDINVNIFSAPEYNAAVEKGRMNLKEMNKAEKKRVRELLSRLTTMYVPHYSNCRTTEPSDYELLIVCDTRIGLDVDENSTRFGDAPLNQSGVDIKGRHFIYPIVRGWYYLLNKKDKTVILFDELTGTGSVIDTAIDDFAKNVISDFSEKIK